MKKLDYHAKLVVHGLPTMGKKELKRLALWLENTGRNLKSEAKEYSKLFTSR